VHGVTPACMTPDELRLWHDANRVLTTNKSDVPCRDCPLTFALEMRGRGRCNGVPLEGRTGRSPEAEQTRLQEQWALASRSYRARQRGDSPLPATASTMAA
jgi:hypothetical protein